MKQTATPNIFQAASNKPQSPTQAEMHMVIGFLQQGRLVDAERAAQRMSAQYPQSGEAWKVLGAVLRFAGRVHDALKPMQTACKLLPSDHEAFNNLGGTLQILGDTHHAEACYKHAIQLRPEYADAIGNLGTMLLSLGRHQDALPLLERKLALTPDDGYIRHLRDALLGAPSERAPAVYVARIFDEQAQSHDARAEAQGYKVPQALLALIEDSGSAPATPWRVLDLGCGTGLMAQALRAKASDIIGVDLSGRMLAKAHAKNLYQGLRQGDIVDAMAAETEASFDIVTAADVFIHTGKLDDVIAQGKRLLRAGGLLAFSVEQLAPAADAQAAQPDHQLKAAARHGHSAAYLARLAEAHGFKSLAQADTVLRTENGQPQQGFLLVWQA